MDLPFSRAGISPITAMEDPFVVNFNYKTQVFHILVFIVFPPGFRVLHVVWTVFQPPYFYIHSLYINGLYPLSSLGVISMTRALT